VPVAPKPGNQSVNGQKHLGRMIGICSVLLLALGLAGCTANRNRIRRMVSTLTAGHPCRHCGPTAVRDWRCLPDPWSYKHTVWSPLMPECPAGIETVEEIPTPSPEPDAETAPVPPATLWETELPEPDPANRTKEAAVEPTETGQAGADPWWRKLPVFRRSRQQADTRWSLGPPATAQKVSRLPPPPNSQSRFSGTRQEYRRR